MTQPPSWPPSMPPAPLEQHTAMMLGEMRSDLRRTLLISEQMQAHVATIDQRLIRGDMRFDQQHTRLDQQDQALSSIDGKVDGLITRMDTLEAREARPGAGTGLMGGGLMADQNARLVAALLLALGGLVSTGKIDAAQVLSLVVAAPK